MQYSYVPLSSTEQDVLARMVEQQSFYVEVVDWGYHPNPVVTSGDKRLQIRFPMVFDRPEGVVLPVKHFHLKLRDRAGKVLVSTIESTMVNNKPLGITAGMQIDLVWDLSLAAISDDIKNDVLPQIRGNVVSRIENGKVVK
jgi:hypothetical protein